MTVGLLTVGEAVTWCYMRAAPMGENFEASDSRCDSPVIDPHYARMSLDPAGAEARVVIKNRHVPGVGPTYG